jgi:chromobox protein 5
VSREHTPPAKKRGRPKKGDQDGQSEEQDASSDDDEARAKKKPRKSQGASAKKVTKQLAEDEEEVTFGSMKKHMTIASWENLVETIDTIERGDEGDLYVYFKMSVDLSYFRCLNAKRICRKHSDVRMREVSRLCAQKFPQKVCCDNLASGQHVTDLTCQAYQVLRIQSAMED